MTLPRMSACLLRFPLIPPFLLSDLQARFDRQRRELDEALHMYGELRRVCSSLDREVAELRRQLREVTGGEPSW